MQNDQILMGAAVAVLCLAGLYKNRWLLRNTNKGRRLVGRFGEKQALWGLRALLVAGTLFGILLATGVINPLQ